MAQPRSQLVSTDERGVFHCVQRCVRRAWLCGEDKYTGISFEHRKQWVTDRIALVGQCFAVAIHAYAVMSNHLHLVLEVDPLAPAHWCDEDVARRWVRLFPPREATALAFEMKCQSVINDPTRLGVIRQRLGSLSWLMKCLVEPIARRANAEDLCKGRFWEGRFKSQVLKDEKAQLAAMAYVDLNPIRAGIANRIEEQQHTSVSERVREANDRPELLACVLQPRVATIKPTLPEIRLRDYLALVEWTGKQLRVDHAGATSEAAPEIVEQMEKNASRWPVRVKAIGSRYWRVVGEAQDLVDTAKALGQRWLRGIGFARSLGRGR
ncbi:MAG: hypothetical protein JNN30_08915 [Rhodanobacteraceae bacterium]|nr:hypothetical protein [Rhodanobacteraceae bacterium]